jgi:hypothetical protein
MDVLTEVQDTGLRYIGFKDVGQPPKVLTRSPRGRTTQGWR